MTSAGRASGLIKALTLFGVSLLLTSGAFARPRCVAAPGNGWLLIRATMLTGQVKVGRGALLVDPSGIIRCVGRCSARQLGATKIDCPGALLSPGFIDAHEHLNYGNVVPVADSGIRYTHRHDWRTGLNGYAKLETFQPVTDPKLLAWMELRHLLAGETSIVGGRMAPGLARNLDFHAGLEGLEAPRVSYEVFPLDDAAGIERTTDCDYGPHPETTEAVASKHAVLVHLGEGVSEAARNEYRCASDPGYDKTPASAGGGTSQDLLLSNVTVLHGVALTRAMLADLARRRVDLVWSPRSNLSLYGKTLDVATAQTLGIIVALGTDWLPSGSMTMVREAACAQAYAAATNGYLDGRTLWEMMTRNAAHAVRMTGKIGTLRPGAAADLILVDPERSSGGDAYARAVNAPPPAMIAILRGGHILAGDAELLGPLPAPDCETVAMGTVVKRLCLTRDAGYSYAGLAEAAATAHLWPAFFVDRPPIEPSCRIDPAAGKD